LELEETEQAYGFQSNRKITTQ